MTRDQGKKGHLWPLEEAGHSVLQRCCKAIQGANQKCQSPTGS